MAVADHIADLVLAVAVFEALEDGYDATVTASDLVISGLTADIDGKLKNFYQKTGAFSPYQSNYAAGVLEHAREVFDVIAGQLAYTIGRSDITPSSSPADIWGIALREWMISNSKEFKSYGTSHGAVSAGGGNVGNGNLINFTDDDQATTDTIENTYGGALTFECVRSASAGNGVSGNEEFSIRGSLPQKHIFGSATGGPPNEGNINVQNSALNRHLANPSFDDTQGAAALTTHVPSWTITTATASFDHQTTTYYRTKQAGTAGQTLRFLGNDTIRQQAVSLPTSGPLYFGIRAYFTTGMDGTLTMKLGSKSVATTVSTLTNATWNHIYGHAYPADYLGGTGVDRGVFSLALSGAATFNLLIDEVNIFQPYLRAGRFWSPLAGSKTLTTNSDFDVADTFTQTDTLAETGNVLKWLYRVYGKRFIAKYGFPLNFKHAASASAGWGA